MRESSHPTILAGIVPLGGRFRQGRREAGALPLPLGRTRHVTSREASSQPLDSCGREPSACPGRHADGNGLYLVVRPSLARSWIQRVTINKQRTDLGLGPYPLVSLAAARRAAIENLLTLRDGRDPRVKAVPTEGPMSPPFREIYEIVTENRRPNWKRKTSEASWHRGFDKYVLPVIGDKLIATISLSICSGHCPPALGRPQKRARDCPAAEHRGCLRLGRWGELQSRQSCCQPEETSSEAQVSCPPPPEASA